VVATKGGKGGGKSNEEGTRSSRWLVTHYIVHLCFLCYRITRFNVMSIIYLSLVTNACHVMVIRPVSILV